MNAGYENMYVQDKLRQRRLLNRRKAAKMERDDGCAENPIYYFSWMKGNIAMRDGKRSGLQGSGP